MSRFLNPTRPRQYATAEQAAGMTGLHRDTRGNIIGGYAADGTPIGSRAKQPAQSATPRLDAGVSTPRLDSNPARPTSMQDTPGTAARPSRFRTYQNLGDGATKAAAAGSQLLRQRQKLFDDMKAAGPELGGDLADRAKSLGVADSSFRKVAQRIGKQPPAMAPVNSRFMAAAGYPAKPSASSPATATAPPAMAKTPTAIPATAAAKPRVVPAVPFTQPATPPGHPVSVGNQPMPQPANPLVRAWKAPMQPPTGYPWPAARPAAAMAPAASRPSVVAPKAAQAPAQPKVVQPSISGPKAITPETAAKGRAEDAARTPT